MVLADIEKLMDDYEIKRTTKAIAKSPYNNDYEYFNAVIRALLKEMGKPGFFI